MLGIWHFSGILNNTSLFCVCLYLSTSCTYVLATSFRPAACVVFACVFRSTLCSFSGGVQLEDFLCLGIVWHFVFLQSPSSICFCSVFAPRHHSGAPLATASMRAMSSTMVPRLRLPFPSLFYCSLQLSPFFVLLQPWFLNLECLCLSSSSCPLPGLHEMYFILVSSLCLLQPELCSFGVPCLGTMFLQGARMISSSDVLLGNHSLGCLAWGLLFCRMPCP